jgi:hypothetical protein
MENDVIFYEEIQLTHAFEKSSFEKLKKSQ